MRYVIPVVLLLAACSDRPDRAAASMVVAGEETAPVRTSAQAAADVVQTYYALIDARKYGEAEKLWGAPFEVADVRGTAPLPSDRRYHGVVGKPGAIRGAAGSLYVEVPVRTFRVTGTGERLEEPVVVTMRRVNDVPGATAEQLRWRIFRIDPASRPH